MSYTITMQPPMMPAGEYTYECVDLEHFKKTYRALKILKVEIIDVERHSESLTARELEELVDE